MTRMRELLLLCRLLRESDCRHLVRDGLKMRFMTTSSVLHHAAVMQNCPCLNAEAPLMAVTSIPCKIHVWNAKLNQMDGKHTVLSDQTSLQCKIVISPRLKTHTSPDHKARSIAMPIRHFAGRNMTALSFVPLVRSVTTDNPQSQGTPLMT